MTDWTPAVPKEYAQLAICVWDPNPARRATVGSIIGSLGARAEECARSPGEPKAGCSVAVVALERGRMDDPGIEKARRLRERGFRVVAVAAGCQEWPLSGRCHVLLAGAQTLLDSEEPAFAEKLAHSLRAAVDEESARFAEVARVREAMRELGVIGASPAITAVFRLVLRAGRLSDVPVLLAGETGTGKELMARALHQLDPKRRSGPFVAFNCAALQPTLAEAELFGHRRGAFTGADRDRLGLFRAADQGVLFLDEIGELDLALQAKLLRVLQDGRVLAVGDDREVPVSVRTIAATNRDLEAMIGQGLFRADLYHRLNVVPIHIPPLRERPEDIAPLVEHFVSKHETLTGVPRLTVDSEFAAALARLPLEGNARELENLVRRALVNRSSAVPLGLADLPPKALRELSSAESASPRAAAQSALGPVEVLEAHHWNLTSCLEYYERLLLEAALTVSRGNHTHAGRLLGVTPRTIYNKVRKLGLCG